MRDDGPRWHPQLLARETAPAHWVMPDPLGKAAGTIELRRTDDGPRYRVEVAGELLGCATSLETATERLHRVIISAGGLGTAHRRVKTLSQGSHSFRDIMFAGLVRQTVVEQVAGQSARDLLKGHIAALPGR